MWKLIVERDEHNEEKTRINLTQPVKIVLTALDIAVASSVVMTSSGTYIEYAFNLLKAHVLNFITMIF